MDINQSLALLGGLSPALFMKRHWQKKPLLVRQAFAEFKPIISRNALFKLAAQKTVESRLIVQAADQSWRMSHGPFSRGKLPTIDLPLWTLLVQGVNFHDERADELLQNFRFLPDARLDDLMISFATEGGGVGPHFDSYDVFLLQASGERRWNISPQKSLMLRKNVQLKILQNFQSEESFVLKAGDMLYLPPRYAHEGIALSSSGENGCMTYSIGFQSPSENQLSSQLLSKLADFQEDQLEESALALKRINNSFIYRDPQQLATETPALIPQGLVDFAKQSIHKVLTDSNALSMALGETLTELKTQTDFEIQEFEWSASLIQSGHGCIYLDSRTRMLYDMQYVFINGESWLAKGADAVFMNQLADQRFLDNQTLQTASKKALLLLQSWYAEGWLHLKARKV